MKFFLFFIISWSKGAERIQTEEGRLQAGNPRRRYIKVLSKQAPAAHQYPGPFDTKKGLLLRSTPFYMDAYPMEGWAFLFFLERIIFRIPIIQDFIQCLHGAHGTAHGAGEFIFRFAAFPIPSGLGGIDGQRNHFFEVHLSSGPGHFSSHRAAPFTPFARSAAWQAILEATMPSCTSSTSGRRRCSAGVT